MTVPGETITLKGRLLHFVDNWLCCHYELSFYYLVSLCLSELAGG